jgi:hypothetical protein
MHAPDGRITQRIVLPLIGDAAAPDAEKQSAA